jgi:hypothetical protein
VVPDVLKDHGNIIFRVKQSFFSDYVILKMKRIMIHQNGNNLPTDTVSQHKDLYLQQPHYKNFKSHNAVSSSECAVPNYSITVNKKSEWMWYEVTVASLQYCPGFCLYGLRKTTEKVRSVAA